MHMELAEWLVHWATKLASRVRCSTSGWCIGLRSWLRGFDAQLVVGALGYEAGFAGSMLN